MTTCSVPSTNRLQTMEYIEYRILLFQLKQVEEYMAYRKLPSNTRNRITEYFEHRYQVIQGYSRIQGDTRRYRGIQVIQEIQEVQENTEGYRGIQKDTEGYRRIQGDIGDTDVQEIQGIQGNTVGYRRIQEDTGIHGYRGILY